MTFFIFVFNEAKRIGPVLDHACKWANEVVILDKGSTDGTLEICRSYGDRVRVFNIPYTDRGHEDYSVLIPQYATEEWVFLSTCSEIPTYKLIAHCQKILSEKADQLDLIYIPRLMYLFGLHRSPENGGVAYYPFLFHKTRVLMTSDIHNNFHARSPDRTYRIPFSEDCCVHHLSYPTVRSYWLSSLDYFGMEVKKDETPEKAIRECFKNIEKLSKRMLLEGKNWFPFYCAIASYELGKALSVWEKAQEPDRAVLKYKELAQQIVAREWLGEAPAPSHKSSAAVRVINSSVLKPLIVVLAKIPYLVVKVLLAFRRLKIKDD